VNVHEKFKSSGDGDAKPKPPRRKRELNPCVLVPMTWLNALNAVPGEHAHKLMLQLLRRSWERRSRTVTVSYEVTAGLMHRTMVRINLIRLQRAGLIIYTRGGPFQAPRATILYPDWHPALPYLTREEG
jgi:hypothetical protein